MRLSPRAKPIVDHLLDLIRLGKLEAGDRVPALRDLAQQHQVSFTVARQAVLQLEQRGVLERVQGSGTYVRGAAKPGDDSYAERDHSITHDTAYLFTDRRAHTSATHNYYLTSALRTRDIPMVECSDWGRPLRRSVGRTLDLWRQHAPRAVVLQYVDSVRDDLVMAAAPKHTRIIGSFRSGMWDPPHWHAVNPDNFSAFRMAASHAIDCGHRRIGVLTKRRLLIPGWAHTRRRSWMWETQQILGAGDAVRRAANECRLSVQYNDPANNDPSGIPTDEVNQQRMTEWLQSKDRPTAVIGEDYRIIGLRRAARQLGMAIPDDLMLIAVGGSVVTDALDLPFVDLRYEQVAQQIVDLIEASDDALRGSVRQVKVPPRLVDADGTVIHDAFL